MNKLFFLVFVFLVSCSTIYQPQKVSFEDYKINNSVVGDANVLQMLQPYSDSINKTMNFVIAESTQVLEKKQPNGSLGLVLVDALKEGAALYYNVPVDAAFINNGGIRIPTLAKGNITVGKVFEIMPFDNLVVLQKIKGSILKDFVNLVSKNGGWPVSGISFTISGGKASNIMIGDMPIDDDKVYTIANSDYIANGGDDADMLRAIPQINKNVLMRDVFLAYFKNKTILGEKITAPTNQRIKNL
jgi:2',3'-cyclic-nucleotide 2'-phosphodiesterase (5'-nucleotidase family)